MEDSHRGGHEVYWIVSLSGLVAGFVYEFHFQWWFVVEGADKHRQYTWKNNFSTSSSSYTFRYPLSQLCHRTFGLNIDTSVWDACIPKEDSFVIEAMVIDRKMKMMVGRQNPRDVRELVGGLGRKFQFQMSCTTSSTSALTPTDKINSVVPVPTDL
jgi:hypothetical protein